jgi:glycosyltransferase involved in cell wall biosynthesis
MYLNRAWDDPPLGFTRKRMILALGKELKKRGGVVLCVDRPFFLAPDILSRPQVLAQFLTALEIPHKVADNVFLFRPLAPLHYLLSDAKKVLRNANTALLGAQVRRVLNHFDDAVRASWIFHPFQSQCLGLARESLSVFEVYDDYVVTSGEKCQNSVQSAERQLLGKVDIVLTTSQALFEKKRQSHPSTFLVPNGVDFDLFSLAAHHQTEIAENVRSLRSPVIGFVGKINSKIDFQLVDFLAAQRPEWNLVFIGPRDGSTAFNCSDPFLTAQARKNIHFLGAVPYESLPSYLKGFEVCILPNVLDSHTAGVYPLKLNEYLATGKPVVSTNFGNLDQFRDVIHIADTKEKFLACVEKALKENTPELIAKRQAVAKSNSWEVRAKTIADIIEERCGQ